MARRQCEDVVQDTRRLYNTTQTTQLIVRTVGFLLLLVGLSIGLKVINESWSLYKEPQNIERLAPAIGKGSSLDKALKSAAPSATDGNRVNEVNSTLGFRLSDFVAWIIGILLLMLVGRLSIAAIKTGGELALYDLQIKWFVKFLVDQSNSERRQ